MKENPKTINVLIVDDDEDYAVIVEKMFARSTTMAFQSTWTPHYEDAMEKIKNGHHHVCLIDFRLGEKDGLELLKTSAMAGLKIPVIMLTGQGDLGVDIQAMKLGAAGYIDKKQLTPETLERTIRYAISLKRTELKLQAANQKLTEIALIDQLTQIPNRRRFDEHLTCEWRRLQREKNSLCLIMCDVDEFKRFNDTYGHNIGDQCLFLIAQEINSKLKRPGDLAARYGGEEFAVILPNTPVEGGARVAETIRQGVFQLDITHAASSAGGSVTLSLGVAAITPNGDISPGNLVEAADRALYEAKNQERNRVVVKS